jgi:hypothetical protein
MLASGIGPYDSPGDMAQSTSVMGNDGELSARPSKSWIGTSPEALIRRARQHERTRSSATRGDATMMPGRSSLPALKLRVSADGDRRFHSIVITRFAPS